MRNPTKKEKKYHDRLANEVGCIVCRKELGFKNQWVSIHHIDGRTKKGCHMKVLPLCYGHHQGIEGIHHPLNSVRGWEKKYGKQMDLKQQCDDILGVQYGSYYR